MRKDDQIIDIEIIHSNSMSASDAIVVVTWGDRSKSMWFANKVPKYVKYMIEYCKCKGAFEVREILSFKAKNI